MSTRRRWSMLVIALSATLCANVFINGVAFLIPTLHTRTRPRPGPRRPGVGDAQLRHGGDADRLGVRGRPRRRTLRAGARLRAHRGGGVRGGVGGFAGRRWLRSCLLGGMAAASSNSASGRLVVGWFAAEQRGLVMGIRQTAQPLGVGVGRVGDPAAGRTPRRVGRTAVSRRSCAPRRRWCARSAVVDPPRPPRAEATRPDLANPYRGSSLLLRIHAVSVLLVVPQVLVWTFTLVWLITDRGWSPGSAGAAGHRGSGARGGRAHRRRPLVGPGEALRRCAGRAHAADPDHRRSPRRCRWRLLALTDWLDSPLSIAVMIVASVVTVSRQRIGVHRHRRDRRAVLERSGTGHAEHQPVVHGRRCAAVVRRRDRRCRLPGGVRGVRAAAPAGDSCGAHDGLAGSR